jgi:hypothetical protein
MVSNEGNETSGWGNQVNDETIASDLVDSHDAVKDKSSALYHGTNYRNPTNAADNSDLDIPSMSRNQEISTARNTARSQVATEASMAADDDNAMLRELGLTEGIRDQEDVEREVAAKVVLTASSGASRIY